MKRILAIAAALFALAAIEALPASAAPTSQSPAFSSSLTIKPLYEKKAAPQRAKEWAEYDWKGLGKAVVQSPCQGPYENGHGKTQWACFGTFEKYGQYEWQVNIDAYGEQTYHELREF